MNSDLYDRFLADLELKGYAKRSIDSYVKSVRQLQRFCNKPVSKITQADLKAYWLACKTEYGWSSATLRISYSGIKLFFSTTLVRKWKIFSQIRWQREEGLPTVLGTRDVRRIICNLPTLQSKVFYLTLYSLGLRLKEAITLKVDDIDKDRKVVHVRNGKGSRDRVIPLPAITLRGLRAYYRTHKNHKLLFPALGHDQGKQAGTVDKPVSPNGVQGALRRTVRKLGIKKHVHPHVFRHSYATHMPEANVPIHHVQKLLGHKDLKSTMVYLHVTTRVKVHSDDIVRQIIEGAFS